MLKDNILAYGKGVQSTAILVLIDNGVLPAPEVIFHSNMGIAEDYLLPYFNEYSAPLIARICTRFGSRYEESNLAFQQAVENHVITPFWFLGAKGKPQLVARRSCTKNFKVAPSNKLIQRRGLGVIWLGISADELKRARDPEESLTWSRRRVNYYPLIELGFTRDDCFKIIADYGLPVPPKSSCDFCPFSAKKRLIERLATDPTLYGRIKYIEAGWHQKPKNTHKFLTQFLGELPTQEEAKKLMGNYVNVIDNSGACGVCEF